MYKYYNANPMKRRSDDCVIRAIGTVLNKPWEEVYCALCELGRQDYDMPSANHIWGRYLRNNGYERTSVPDMCPDCYTVEKFAEEHRIGRYILALNGHVVACIDGVYYDTWNSGDEIVLYYWKEKYYG